MTQPAADRERTIALILALQGKTAPSTPTAPEPPCEKTTILRTGEVFRETPGRKIRLFRTIDPLP